MNPLDYFAIVSAVIPKIVKIWGKALKQTINTTADNKFKIRRGNEVKRLSF